MSTRVRFLLPAISFLLSVSSLAQDSNLPTPISLVSASTVRSGTAGESRTLVSNNFGGALKSDEAEVSGTMAANAVEPANPAPAFRVEPRVAPTRTPELQTNHRRAWLVLTTAQHGGALFDAWSTRQAIASGRGYERDVLVKPFANSPAIYPALQIVPLGLDFLSHRMLRSSNSFNRKLWWVPQAVATAGFVWCGTRNLRVAR